MNLDAVGLLILNSIKEGASAECTAILDGVLWRGVVTLTKAETVVATITTPPVYVSSDIACGGVEFLVATIKACLVERKQVKSWEAPALEIKDARLSA